MSSVAPYPSSTGSNVSVTANTTKALGGKSQVSYELFAPRATNQVSRLSRIAALTAGSAAVGNDKKNPDGTSVLKAMSPAESASCSTYHLRTKQTTPTEIVMEKAVKESDHLTLLLKHSTSLRLALRASINIAEDISSRHSELIRHSGELSAAADRLQGEQEILIRHAEEIGMPLKHYDAVDNVGVLVGVLFKGRNVVRGLAKIKVDNEDFPAILDQIDDAVEFFARESGGREALAAEMKRQSRSNAKDAIETSGSIEYYRRSLALQEAALFLIREAVVDRILKTTTQVSSALNIPTTPVAADKLEASLVFTRFHGISSRSNRLLCLVRDRLNRGEAYHELFQLCRTTYCNSRHSLLRGTIQAHMDKLKGQHGLVGMTRLASVFLVRLCTVETALYLDFFGEKRISLKTDERKNPTKIPTSVTTRGPQESEIYYDKDFQGYLISLTSALHRTIRRGLVTVLDLDTLCQIVSVLREERSMASSSPTTLAAARTISNVIEDAQERLIFCATNSLTKEVLRFKASPSDLDYPNKLTNMNANKDSEKSGSEDDVVKRQLEVYNSWFPPMRSVLKILSKIFRVVEPKVFEDIALQSVKSCTRSLRDGSKYIEKRSGTIHADLFLVKHLLILREQLSPFDIELRSVERQLDFSDAGKAVTRFLANRNRRLFSMSTENALVMLLREGVSVNEESVDSKRDLEEALRNACNDFIEHTCYSLAGGCTKLVCDVDTVNPESLSGVFNASKVSEIVSKTQDNFAVTTTEIAATMNIYLENPVTQSILLKPVSKKVTKVLNEIRQTINSISDDSGGWNKTNREEIHCKLDELEQEMKRMGRTPK